MDYVALLRGVNVGGRNIKMTDLKACFEEMGFEGATTFSQTGNVVFRSTEDSKPPKEIVEAGLQTKFDYPARVFLYGLEHLRRIIEASPFGDGGPDAHSYVIFFDDGLEKHLAAEAMDLDNQVESIQTGNGVLYWQVQKGVTLSSALGKRLTKSRYKNFHTNRNINTLRKMV